MLLLMCWRTSLVTTVEIEDIAATVYDLNGEEAVE